MLADQDKTKEQLINELEALRQQLEEISPSPEETYRNLVNMSPDVIFIVSPDGRFQFLNPAFEKITGWSGTEWVGRPFTSIIHPDDLPLVMERFQQGLEGEIPLPFESRFLCKSGDYLVGEVVGAPHTVNGKVVAGYGFVRDVSQRKQAEEKLAMSEAKYRSLVETSASGIGSVDLEGRLTFINERLADMIGYSREELVGKPFVDVVHPEDRSRLLSVFQESKAHPETSPCFECRLVHKDGRIVWCHSAPTSLFINGEFVGGSAIVVDIIERKRAEEVLRESEEKYRSLVTNISLGIFRSTPEPRGRFLEVNPAMERITGYSREELLQMYVADLYRYPEERERVLEDIASAKGMTTRELRFRKKDGTEIIISDTKVAVRNNAGQIMYFDGIMEDITEHKRMENELRHSEERLRILFEYAPDAYYLTDIEGNIVDGNRAAEELVGYRKHEVVGRNLFELGILAPEDISKAKAFLEAIVNGQAISPAEYSIARKDGTRITIEERVFPVEVRGKRVVLSIARDITERKKIEEERLKFEKLESIGTLAGGIAHDFNNILTAILGNITLAERHIEPEGKAAERLLEAKKASLRAKDLTQQLLTFARGGMPIRKAVSTAELLQEAVTFALRGSKVKCEFSLPEDLWPVEIDEGQISQVITNLVINADEAMPGGGIINIGAKNTVIKGKGALPLAKGNYVEITVKDQGIGIPKEHLGRIFEPYFTTKQKGSGLGLATAYSIIKNHGGYIIVQSELGAGATFYIYLRASKKPISKKKEEEAPQAVFLGKGRILVMDDEEMIREMLSSTLSSAGYAVELTKDGAEAIERCAKAKESGQPFDAVILDATIPGGMGGKEVIKKLLEIDPGIKAIVSSGYSTDPVMAKFREYGFSAVATKPYSVGELERTLRSVLGQKK